MDRVAIDLGFLQIYWYSIFIFLGILVACIVIYRETIKRELDKDFMIDLAFNTIIIGILGARLYYVLFNLSYYLSNPFEILEIWNGGLAIHGGLIFGLLAVIYSCKKHNQELIKVLDVIVVGVIIGQAIGRWGNYYNQEAYGFVTTAEHLKEIGLPSSMINGMYIMGEYRNPTFLYESIWNFFGFFVLLFMRRRKNLKTGQISGFYFMWYSVIRFILEGQRGDSLMLGPFRMARLMSILLFALGLYLFIYYKKIKKESKFWITKNDKHLYEEKEEKEKQPLFYKDGFPKQ